MKKKTVRNAREDSTLAADADTDTQEKEIANAENGREDRLEKLAKNHILASMGVGLIPIPIVDLVALTGIQLTMLKKISAEYDIPFRQDLGKSLITSLTGGFLSVFVGVNLASFIKWVPLVGQTAGAVTMPVLAGASTYAIHKVFVQHFESGGTFLDMDPSRVKDYFAEQFKKGKEVADDLNTEQSAKTTE